MSIIHDIKAHRGDIDDIDFHPNSKKVIKLLSMKSKFSLSSSKSSLAIAFLCLLLLLHLRNIVWGVGMD